MFRRHPVITALTLVYLGLVAWITLGPQPLDDRAEGTLYRLLRVFGRHASTEWITYDLVEFAANVAMFVPIGVFLLLLMGRSWWLPAIVAGIALTFVIEFIQLFLPTRVPDVRDLVSNSFGAVIGVLAALLITTPAALRDRRHQRELAAARAQGATATR